MESLGRKTAWVARFQLASLSATWLAGIYVNGFVAILPGSGVEAILLNPAVAAHVVLAVLSAATSVFLVGLAWAGGSSRVVGLTLLASLSVVVAGDSGLAFVLGGGSDSGQSMIMASAFVTAIFLTFLSMADLENYLGDGQANRVWVTSRGPLVLSYIALVLFFLVFVTGMFVNLFVAGPVFSLPLNSQLPAFVLLESSTPFIVHEVLGGVLLVILVVLSLWLWASGAKRLALGGAMPSLLVAYSAFVGSLNLTSPLAAVSVWVPMLSSSALIVAIVSTMLLSLRIRASLSSW